MKRFVLLMVGLYSLICIYMGMVVFAQGPPKQTLLGGVEYVNWAWGYSHYARYIDGKGNIYKVNHDLKDSIWMVGVDGTFSEEEIQRLFKKAIKFSRKVPKDTLKMINKLIKPASEGKYSERVHTADDAGGTASFAFLYDSVSKSYKKFELRVEGDLTYENTSQSAQQLHEIFRRFLARKRR